MSGLVDIWVHTWLYPQVAFIGMRRLPWFVLEVEVAQTLEMGLQSFTGLTEGSRDQML